MRLIGPPFLYSWGSVANGAGDAKKRPCRFPSGLFTRRPVLFPDVDQQNDMSTKTLEKTLNSSLYTKIQQLGDFQPLTVCFVRKETLKRPNLVVDNRGTVKMHTHTLAFLGAPNGGGGSEILQSYLMVKTLCVGMVMVPLPGTNIPPGFDGHLYQPKESFDHHTRRLRIVDSFGLVFFEGTLFQVKQKEHLTHFIWNPAFCIRVASSECRWRIS